MSQTCSTSAPDFSTPHSANRAATSSRGTLGSKLKLDWSSDVTQTQHSKTGGQLLQRSVRCGCGSSVRAKPMNLPLAVNEKVTELIGPLPHVRATRRIEV